MAPGSQVAHVEIIWVCSWFFFTDPLYKTQVAFSRAACLFFVACKGQHGPCGYRMWLICTLPLLSQAAEPYMTFFSLFSESMMFTSFVSWGSCTSGLMGSAFDLKHLTEKALDCVNKRTTQHYEVCFYCWDLRNNALLPYNTKREGFYSLWKRTNRWN